MGDERDFTSARAKEALLKDKDEKCCGNCCWFCFELPEGDGQCMSVGYHGMPYGALTYCGTPPCKHYVSRQEMRHHMAVLLKEKRWKLADGWITGKIVFPPSNEDVLNALSFAYKYIKVFSKL